jgi:mannose/fructose/N-acetylgalactosamine-specific phosphotransferase system component IID
MILVAIAWGYVVVMMEVAEAMAPNGSGLGAVFTLLLYGVLPLAVVLYILNTPYRRRAHRAREQAAVAATAPMTSVGSIDGAGRSGAVGPAPDERGQPPGDAVPTVREPP